MRKIEELRNGCMAKAEEGEMTFVLLSRDVCAAETIRFWAHRRIVSGKNQLGDPQIVEALNCARIMEVEKGTHKR